MVNMKRSVLDIVLVFVVMALFWASSGWAAEWKVFFGNLHSHTAYSDGCGTPYEAYQYARNKAKLDFLAITEHNHRRAESAAVEKNHDSIAHHHELYNGPQSSSLIKAAQRCTKPGAFVAIYGQEFSTNPGGNHVNVFEVGEVIDEAAVPNKEYACLTEWLASHRDSIGVDAVIEFNHPVPSQRNEGVEYGADDFSGQTQWTAEMGRYARLIAIQNGPSHDSKLNQAAKLDAVSSYHAYLAMGFKLGPVCDQDNHYPNWGSATRARTAVVAKELTKEMILEGLRQRHVYATQDENLRIVFLVQGQLCGDVVGVPAQGEDLDIAYAIWDDDEPDAAYGIEIWGGKVGGEPAKKLVPKMETIGSNQPTQLKRIEEIGCMGEGSYVMFKVTQEGAEDHADEVAWTAPVWFENASTKAGAIASASTPTDAENFVASKNSPMYHLSDACGKAKNILPQNRISGQAAMKGRELHEGCRKP